MFKLYTIRCNCGYRLVLTKIQFDDFDVGAMGILNCYKCKKIILPTSHAEEVLKITSEIVEGEDKGWV